MRLRLQETELRKESIVHQDQARFGPPTNLLPHIESAFAPAALQLIATVRPVRREQTIIEQNGEGDSWYCVISGAARQFIISPEGRRQIVDILLPGDFFGFGPDKHARFAVQAITDGTIIARYPGMQLDALANSDPRVARELRGRLSSTVARLQEQILLVSTMTATEKVRAFLFHMIGRLPSGEEDTTYLPMSRHDIADQLGISVETVSRSITDLQSAGVIELAGPRTIGITAKARG
jgi:CRP/FNR family nitrogen fixation transcriptional regulator